MQTLFLKTVKDVIKYWYIPLLAGLFFVVVSIVTFSSPMSSLLTLSVLFALSFIFGGLSEAVFSFLNRDRLESWGWTLAFGVVTVVVGVLLLSNPALSITTLAFYIGFIILFRSVSAIGIAMDIKKYGSRHWAGLLILGILGAVFSFVLIWNPVFAGLSVVMLVALSFFTAGLFSMVLAFQLRQLHTSTKALSAQLKERYDALERDIREEWSE